MTRSSGCVAILLFSLAVMIGGGAILMAVVKARAAQDRVYCTNNLRQLGMFAALPPVAGPDAPVDVRPSRVAVPSGTVVNPGLPVDRRLSWVADALPVFDRRQHDPALVKQLDRTVAWDTGPNATVTSHRIGTLTCPGNPSAAATTQYLGASGLDPAAADLGLGPPVPARAGCFRYNEPTPYDVITDGLNNTILFVETNRDLGPWLQGGSATVRGLFDGTPALPSIGVGGQFGGNHAGGGNFCFVDGSVRFLSDRVSTAFLSGLMTIAGGPGEEL